MEWRFYLVNRGDAANSKRMVERRTAVVQIADSSGFILVIQIYHMSRMSFFFFCLSIHFLFELTKKLSFVDFRISN